MIGFAHRGYPGRAPDNSVAGYRLALEAGARALEGDVWPSADGHAVLDHDGRFRRWGRVLQVPSVPRRRIPRDTVADLYAACGTGFELSLDVKDPGALEPTYDTAVRAGAARRLWLCHPDWTLVATWRERVPAARLVDSTRAQLIPEGVAARAARLADHGIDALNMPFPDWDAAGVAACHRAGVLALAWHAHKERHLRAVLALGVDGVFSDDVEMMVRVLEEAEAG